MQGNNEDLISVSEMSVGQKALVVGFSFGTEMGKRIQEIGLVPGEHLEVMRRSPLGDPIEIRIRGYFLSLKKQEAESIMVKLFLTPS